MNCGQFLRFFAIALTVCALVGCNAGENLQPLRNVIASEAPALSATANFCTEAQFIQRQKLKTIIIFDHSGSNQQNVEIDPLTGYPRIVNGQFVVRRELGTDPSGLFRFGSRQTPGTLLHYLANHPINDPLAPEYFYAYVGFNSSTTTYPVNSSGFTSDIADFSDRMFDLSGRTLDSAGQEVLGSPNDSGPTNYLAALAAAERIIRNDISRERSCADLSVGSLSPGPWCPEPGIPSTSGYVIVFLSDGVPYAQGFTPDQPPEAQAREEILASVLGIMSLVNDAEFVSSINLFATYYYVAGNEEEAARELMADMARYGNGVYYDTVSGQSLDWNRFRPSERWVTFDLDEVFVTNTNVTWWDDAVLYRDRDADGLPDHLDSSPNTPRSGGILDLVRYRLNGVFPSVCSGINRNTASDPNGLRDYEKCILNDAGGIGTPDSNRDGVPDWLLFRAGMPFQVGTRPSVWDYQHDGLSVKDKIKFSLPVAVSQINTINVTPANYSLRKTMVADRNCYQLEVRNIPFLESEPEIRIDIMMRSETNRNNYIYRVGYKRVAPNSQNVHFADWNDPIEQALGTWEVWR